MATEYIKDKQRLVGIRYMLFIIAAVNAIISVVMSITSSFMESTFPIYLQSLISGLLAYIIPITIYARTTKVTAKTAKERFYMNKCRTSVLFLAFVMGAAFQFVMVVANLPVNLLFNNSTPYLPETVFELVASMVIVAVLPAIFEEFLFRGIVVGSMVEFNTTAAAVFSSVMFAILHADMYGMLGYLLMGFVLTSVVRRSTSLYPAMIFHFANNMTALLLGYFNEELVFAPIVTIVMFVTGVIVFIVTYMIYEMMYKRPEKTNAMKTGQLLGQSFVSMPIILSIVMVAITAVLARNM